MSISMSTGNVSEFEDVIESEKSLADWLQAVKRRKLSVIITVTVLFLLTLIIAFALPPIYKSTGTILIEQQEIPQEFVRSTITTYADQRLQIIQQRVMTSSNLFEIINKFNLYSDILENKPREVVLQKMRNAISLDMISAEVMDPRSGRPTRATIAFQVSFESENPSLAQKVANEITGLFLDENIKERTSKAQSATQFLEDEADKLEKEIQGYEQKLADFKTGNVEKLPELVSMNLSMMERADQGIRQIDTQLRALKERKIYLESQLAQISPHQALYSESGERLLSKGDRLRTLKIELAQKTGIYSDDHPDITRIKREIKSLEAETDSMDSSHNEAKVELQLLKQQLQEAEQRYSSDHPDVKSLKRSIAALESSIGSSSQTSGSRAYPGADEISNPAYSQLLAQLEATNAEIRSLQVSRNQTQAKINELEQRLLESPEVEREYRVLVRDYETARAKYIDVKAKINEAKIGESLELGNQGEKFTIIEPPMLPEEPESPNRPALIALGLLLSLAFAFGVVVLRESMDPSVYGRNSVLKLTGYMPLASLPTIYTNKEKANIRKAKILVIGMVMGGIIILLALIHFFHTPLDILYYKLLRKF